MNYAKTILLKHFKKVMRRGFPYDNEENESDVPSLRDAFVKYLKDFSHDRRRSRKIALLDHPIILASSEDK